MKHSERMNYDKMFESLRPINGTVAGDKVNIIKLFILVPNLYYNLFVG